MIKMTKIKNKILIYGGAFDPPHIAHVLTARNTLNFMKMFGFEELWFMPCNSDILGKKKLSPAHHRVNMLSILTEQQEPSFKVSTFEIDHENKLGTLALMKMLQQAYPSTEFRYVIGSDQAAQINTWRDSQQLVDEVGFVVVIRNEYEDERKFDWAKQKPHEILKYEDITDGCSSTMLRALIENRTEVAITVAENYLSREVLGYIIKNNLYKQGIQNDFTD